MTEFLEAFDGYVPWIAVIVIAVLFRLGFTRCLSALALRLRKGATLRVGPLELGGGDAERIKPTTEEATKAGVVAEQYGNPDNFTLLFKAVGPRLSKSTKAMQMPGGCLVLVSSELWTEDGEWSTSEALEYVPGVVIVKDESVVNGYTLRAPAGADSLPAAGSIAS